MYAYTHRVRPPNAREGRSALGLRTCVAVDEDAKTVRLKAAAGASAVVKLVLSSLVLYDERS